MTVNVENLKEFAENLLLELISKFSKVKIQDQYTKKCISIY